MGPVASWLGSTPETTRRSTCRNGLPATPPTCWPQILRSRRSCSGSSRTTMCSSPAAAAPSGRRGPPSGSLPTSSAACRVCLLCAETDQSLGRDRHRLRLAPAGAAEPEIDLAPNEQHAQADEYRADRPGDEDGEIAARDQHGAAEIFLEARSEHEAEQNRRRVKSEPQQDVAEKADHEHFGDLEHVVVGGIDPDADEEQRTRIEIAVRNGQHLHPDADQRHVE